MNHYRGKQVDTNEWIYGDLVQTEKQCFIVNGVVESNSEYITIEDWQEVIPETVGQYTGMEIDGVKLYAGMKFKYMGLIFTISYSEDEYMWQAVSNNGNINRLPLWNFLKNRIEIIQD